MNGQKFDDGGPMFPSQSQGPTTGPEIYFGASLLDWFAGQALAGLMATPAAGPPEQFAASCYAMAAAMLRERARLRLAAAVKNQTGGAE